jgi:hypothetical protein
MLKRAIVTLGLLSAVTLCSSTAHAQNQPNGSQVSAPDVSDALQHDVSPALRDMAKAPRSDSFRLKKFYRLSRQLSQTLTDPVIQTTATSSVATASGLNFAGVGNGDYGFAPNAAPPDTNGAVGATQYVQWVNESFAVFSKSSGALLHGPVAGNTLWSGFGGGCETNNDGDPVVQYDKAANRWIFTQFSVSTTPYLQCVAVSTTSDATGTYNRYAFPQPNFNDYPKLGVWPDGYYLSFNMFSGNSFVGGRACAFDRTAMLAGGAATEICFQLTSTYGGLLPSDLDGSTPPPAGAPNVYVAFGNNSASLDLWNFHADFTTPANSTFSHTNIAAPAFAAACNGGGTCIPQSGTTQKLDSLADRLMYRLAYRNFGNHEALVVNHSVTAGSSVGVRWYEIRSPSTAPVVYQSGTYAPDSNYRWMGSIAMDKVGNIALGYSVSSATMHPSISYTGRAPTDSPGTMQGENLILTGAGSQTSGLTRWGDYSAMTIDPGDDCTFYYTTEYLKASGSFNWSTRIASFKFPSCGGAPPALTTITVSPASASMQTGAQQQFSATAYDQYGSPLSPQPAVSWTVNGGGSISSTGLFIAGTIGGPFTVTASSGSVNGTASVTVTTLVANFTLSVNPTSQSVRRGSTANYTVTVNKVNGFTGAVTLSLTGQPSGSTVTFTPNPATGTSTLTVKTLSSSTRTTYTLTIKGVSGSLSHTVTAALTVTR